MGRREGRCDGAFWAPRVLVVCSCALLIYSFVAVDVDTSTVTHALSDDVTNSRSPRLVFMVIDAFRLSFLTSSEYSMKFTRSSTSNQSSSPAKLFDAYARMPTVTLPRITAYITGTLPSFGTILTNLATEEIKVDNWVSRLTANGKKVHFFGDDTWIRLLPGQFQKSEGVTSFFVKDYTEVDNNVTRHLDHELASDEWDALILHYLGLDHIGHSLGGTSSKINEKLVEMDGIIERIHRELSQKPTESYLIVCGDHGMTPAGSHGGASNEETRVPVVIWSINGKTEEEHDADVRRIEQIDISATIFDLFDMPLPPDSYGISLSGVLRNNNEDTLRHQYSHFKSLVKASKLSISDDLCERECDFTSPFIRSTVEKWIREVQEQLIGCASDIPNFALAITVVLLSIALSICLFQKHYQWTEISLFLINVAYFASSLIEEEHEIWFFLASTMIAVQILKCIKNEIRGNGSSIRNWITLGVFHRIAMGYVQSSRRRWTMDPNLLPPDVFANSLDMRVKDINDGINEYPLSGITVWMFLWIGIEKNYMVLWPLISHILRFLEYTVYDAYYLVFFRLSILPLSYVFRGSRKSLIVSLLLVFVPLQQLPLMFIIFQIGRVSSKLQLTAGSVVLLCSASFFYTGNSNSLSTLSLTSGYIGLLDYYPLLVGIQLLMSTFSGPIVFLCGRRSSEFLTLQFSFRISCLMMSLFCLFFFQHHLFVWSVYSPKVVYDMVIVIFFLITGLFI